MDFLLYLIRFLYRIRRWLIIAPLLITLLVIWKTRHMAQNFPVDMTIYTGVVSGFAVELGDAQTNSTVVNNTIDNIVNIVKSKETLQEVSLRLYARHMIYGNTKENNTYIQASSFRQLLRITPEAVKDLIDYSSEENTVRNLKEYMKVSPNNFVYGLFNWNHPHYCFAALNKIQVQRLGNSDMLYVSYASNDPGVAYQTLVLLDEIYVKNYQKLQFGSTNSAIKYFEAELERIGRELRANEDSLTNYNIRNRIINYDEQTKQVAALDKEFEMKYQEVLLVFNSANAAIDHLEKQLGENVNYLKGNAQFLKKLEQISQLNARVSEMEMFYNDSTSSSYIVQKIKTNKEELKKLEEELAQFTQEKSNSKFTRDGYPTSNFVAQWLDELMKRERAQSEIAVMEKFKSNLDKRYSHFSPIGSTIKRQERSIDFIERSYLSILSSLNAARLRLKSLEMNSASLQVVNSPTYPLNAEPTKRKTLVLAAYFGTLTLILGFFLLVDVLDRTLRDKVRTERITSGKVLAAFPGKMRFRRRKFTVAYQNRARQYLANALVGTFRKKNKRAIVNFISTHKGSGKSYIVQQLQEYWSSNGIIVKVLNYEESFSAESRQFLFATSAEEIADVNEYDILLIEHSPLSSHAIPVSLLQEADINLVVTAANRVWEERDQLLLSEMSRLSDTAPVYLCLNYVEKDVLEGFTGMLPPYTLLKKLLYRYIHLGLTSKYV